MESEASHKLRTASPQSLDVILWRTYKCGGDNSHFAEGKLSRPNWSCEASTLRSGYRICIPHRQPQLEVRSRDWYTPRQTRLANREVDMPSGEPLISNGPENMFEFRYNTSQRKSLLLVERLFVYILHEDSNATVQHVMC